VSGLYDKLGIFGSCPILLLKDRRLKPNCIRVYIAIQSFEGTNEEAWPSIDSIAERAGISRQAVTKAAGQLIDTGWLWRKRRLGQTNLYRCLADLDAVEIETMAEGLADMRKDRPQPTLKDGRNPRSSPKKSVNRQPKRSVDLQPNRSVSKRPTDKINGQAIMAPATGVSPSDAPSPVFMGIARCDCGALLQGGETDGHSVRCPVCGIWITVIEPVRI
jgi:hypothetical protein